MIRWTQRTNRPAINNRKRGIRLLKVLYQGELQESAQKLLWPPLKELNIYSSYDKIKLDKKPSFHLQIIFHWFFIYSQEKWNSKFVERKHNEHYEDISILSYCIFLYSIGFCCIWLLTSKNIRESTLKIKIATILLWSSGRCLFDDNYHPHRIR